MKRIMAIIAALLMLAACLPGAAVAEEIEEREVLISGDWQYYLLEDGGAELYEYTGKAGTS